MSNWNVLAFFLAGIFNNSSYVIMNAGAKNIAPSMVGIVYVCNVLPAFLTKLTGPYWFHHFTYKTRLTMISVSMALSFILVALGASCDLLWVELIGIMIGSFQVCIRMC
jgi:battenin